jgi:hypothetical protein
MTLPLQSSGLSFDIGGAGHYSTYPRLRAERDVGRVLSASVGALRPF